MVVFYIEEAHPLKQGLKLRPALRATKNEAIEEAHPLKQGLKPWVSYCNR